MSKNKRLKILFLPTWYPSEEKPVAGIFIQEHAKAVSLYNEVLVLYNEGYDESLKKSWQIISDEKEDGIRTIRVRHKKSPIPKTTQFIYLWSIRQTFNKLLKEGWRPDIIHAHVYSAGVSAVLLGKRHKIPVITSEHFSRFLSHKLNFIEKIKVKIAMNGTNIILPVSRNLEEAIRSYHIQNEFRIIPNTVDNIIFSISPRETRNKKKKILFVGLLTPIKGIPYLLKALAQLRKKREDFILDIVGDGSNREEYENLVKKLAIQDIVKFHGLKPREDVAEFMRNCDFFVGSSLWETFGVVYIEAMACGKPIVTTELPALRELISKERGILVPPKNVDALVEAINYMLDHFKDFSPEKISQYVSNNFSYEVIGGEINKIYKEILKNHGRQE